MRHIFFKEDFALQHFQAALYVFESQPDITLAEFFKIGLRQPAPIVMQAYKETLTAGILGQVNEAGVAVFENVVDQFLDDPENDQFTFSLQAFAVVVKPGAGIHAAGAADLLEQVVHGRFQPEILEGGGHQAVGDVPDQLDGIVDDLFGIVDALELGLFVEVHKIFIEVEAGRGEQGTRRRRAGRRRYAGVPLPGRRIEAFNRVFCWSCSIR